MDHDCHSSKEAAACTVAPITPIYVAIATTGYAI